MFNRWTKILMALVPALALGLLLASRALDAEAGKPKPPPPPSLKYSITLISGQNWVRSFAHGMNDSGDVVGTFMAEGTSGYRPFLYTGGVILDLNDMVASEGWTLHSAQDINNSGQIVGYATAADGSRRAYRYTLPSKPEDPGEFLVLSAMQNAVGINDWGDVVGRGVDGERPYLYIEGQGFVELPPTSEGRTWSAAAINNFCDIAGITTDASGRVQAVRYTYANNSVTLLGFLKPKLVDRNSFATDITDIDDNDDNGWVVGYSDVRRFQTHAFLYQDQTGMVDLGTLGGENSAASGINSRGQVVGISDTASGSGALFVYTQLGGMQEVSIVNLPPDFEVGGGRINYSGVIAGTGWDLTKADNQAYVATPLP